MAAFAEAQSLRSSNSGSHDTGRERWFSAQSAEQSHTLGGGGEHHEGEDAREANPPAGWLLEGGESGGTSCGGGQGGTGGSTGVGTPPAPPYAELDDEGVGVERFLKLRLPPPQVALAWSALPHA